MGLQTLEGVPGSDYINANFCDGYRKQNAYVATQVNVTSVLDASLPVIIMFCAIILNICESCNLFYE